MSGILGIYYLDDRPVERECLTQLSETLAHRGPDGANVWLEDAIGLGHRMLWTTPESLLETLPLQRDDLVITADARIDNRNELLAVLDLDNRPIDKIPDSEFILAAYKKWGEACPDYLLGDFAFAIWDQRQQQLFCARDHFGVKPFYYYHQAGHCFLFASELKAFFSQSEVPRRLNELKLGEYLAGSLDDITQTTYAGIFRLPPASCLRICPTEIRLWSYWSLDRSRSIQLESDEAYAETFRAIFTEAVRCRLRSVYPIGSQLSGGLDSSAVTCVARNLLVQAEKPLLHTVSNVFDQVCECDERPFINAVLQQGNVIAHTVHPDRLGPLSCLDEMWRYEDEAFIGPNHVLPWELNRAANQIGIRVFLDGFDGDTTVSHGILRLKELAQQQQWETFWQEAQGVAQHFNTSPSHLLRVYGLSQLQELAGRLRWLTFAKAVDRIHQRSGISRKHLVFQYGIKPLLPKSLLQMWHPMKRVHPSSSPLTLVNSDFADRIGLDERLKTLDRNPEPAETVRDEQWRALTAGVLVFVLEALDRAAAAFSIEARHPFMDKRLIEFCLALPPEQKLNQGWSRSIMRRALNAILPESIQWRGGKTDMTPNFLHGLLTINQQQLESILYNPSTAIEDYINLESMRTFYEQITSEKKACDADMMTFWRGTILSLWLRQSNSKCN